MTEAAPEPATGSATGNDRFDAVLAGLPALDDLDPPAQVAAFDAMQAALAAQLEAADAPPVAEPPPSEHDAG